MDAEGNFVSWDKHPDTEWLCLDDASCDRQLGVTGLAFCGTVYDAAGLDPLYYDNIRNEELIMYGIPNFDHFGHAIVTIFQVLTLESWSYLMYNFSDANGATISVIFFILIVILGSFFTMNLVLAMIMDKFNEQIEERNREILKE